MALEFSGYRCPIKPAGATAKLTHRKAEEVQGCFRPTTLTRLHGQNGQFRGALELMPSDPKQDRSMFTMKFAAFPRPPKLGLISALFLHEVFFSASPPLSLGTSRSCQDVTCS